MADETKTLYVGRELRDKIVALATKEDRTIVNVIRRAVELYEHKIEGK